MISDNQTLIDLIWEDELSYSGVKTQFQLNRVNKSLVTTTYCYGSFLVKAFL